MAALVQGYPQQSGTVTVLQTRPSSASGMLQSLAAQPVTQYVPGGSHRHSIHGLPSATTTHVVYRGGAATVQQPYALNNAPLFDPLASWQPPRAQRTSSSPAVPTIQQFDYLQPAAGRSRYSASVSMTNLPSTANYGLHSGAGSRDDSGLPVPGARRTAAAPRSSHTNNGASSQPSLAPAAPIRATPERYRRTALRADSNSSSTTPSGSQLRPVPSAMANRPNSFVGSVSGSAVDDSAFAQGQHEIKRVRRRSMPALDSPGFPLRPTPHDLQQQHQQLLQPEDINRPKSADLGDKAGKTGNHLAADKTSNDERPASSRSAGANVVAPSSSSANPDPTVNPTMPASPEHAALSQPDSASLANVPPPTLPTDAANANASRTAKPSPLSTPAAMDAAAETSQPVEGTEPVAQEAPSTPRFESPAVRQLTAINEKRGRPKSKTSRLRRAFSFGSASEFRKAAGEAETAENGAAKLQKDRNPDEAYDEEQARIAERQEAAGIGNNIYAGGRFFHGSTDNLSISSTASSASIMIRKMGRGMKKGTRSLVGLFRPKSVVGVPPPDAIPESPQPAVSMITAEAERELVNVSADPKAQGGGTGFPRLERNSIDAAKVPVPEPERVGSSGTDSTGPRKSIVGGEKERAEVLAAVRKGILKHRTGSSSPSPRPSDAKTSASDLPSVPSVTDSPSSTAPSTPNEDSQGHRRTGTVTIGSEDYFVSALRLRQDSKSSPGTPQSVVKRNATFSPRLAFFETWPSQEYDRRGEIATCNRLTPMLAQQIKEELNTFKMEMEVHENSKIYTHFF
ncbi:uncharacterized protein C8A04DRAFT_34511 [Dichotomopilus funicola]|uniref:Uncharacterized protein n=1 Tax=Dichotomopilus funicola TaxID=1934379 RepID=A0AAN6V9M6_9PEZI|nr:hypothetical protein C8A04DRAFT_34511 [Dichotomopilus funicola]